jgi:hypothetical protein
MCPSGCREAGTESLEFNFVFDILDVAHFVFSFDMIVFDVAGEICNPHRSLCDLLCVSAISFTGFSTVGIANGQFPQFSFTISVLGTEHTFSSQSLDLNKIASWTFHDVLNSVKSSIGIHSGSFLSGICVFDSNCPSATPICDSSQNFKCVASCRAGYSRAVTGCL